MKYKLYAIAAFSAFIFSENLSAQIASPQDKITTETYFKDFDWSIDTPAFKKKKGFTKYSEMMPFLNNLVQKHSDVVRMSFIGKSQKGLEIPMLILNKNNGIQNKPKVWIQAGIHGNEPASTEGVLYLIQQLLENPENKQLVDNLEIGIVPMANIDGYNHQERTAADGLDLNRDQTKLVAHESPFLKKAFSDFGANVALDFHEFHPFRSDYLQMGKSGYTVPYDVMILYSGNLNVPQSIRSFTKDVFVKNAEESLSSQKLTYHDYFTTANEFGETVLNVGSINPRSSATSYALSDAVSTLVEVRGIDLGRTSFKRRIATTFLIAKSYLESALNNKDELFSLLEKSKEENNSVIVKSARKASEEPMEFIDLHTNKLVQAKVQIRNSLLSSATLTRSMPSAYILLPTEKVLAEKLKTLGLNITELSVAQNLPVENYLVKSYLKDDMPYEGIHQQTVTTENRNVIRNFPAGSFIVSTDQKNKGLAFETLEPEAGSSFVSLGVLMTSQGQELPLYRFHQNLSQLK